MKLIGSDRRYALVVVALTLLAGLLVFLFIVKQEAPGREELGFPPEAARGHLSSGGAPPSAVVGVPLASSFFLGTGASPVVAVEATLSNDQDHDGKYDGMADPLVVLLCAVVVFAIRFVLLLLLPASGFSLRFGEPSKMGGSDHRPALERPG